MTPPSKRFKGVGGGINNRRVTKKQNFPKNMPFDYVENVRASMASSIGTEVDEIDTASDGFQFDLATAQSITTQGGQKQRNMPFDYVENVRASLASSIATDADEEIDGVEDARKSFNISSSAGGSEQFEGDDSSQQETYDDADDSSEAAARNDDGRKTT